MAHVAVKVTGRFDSIKPSNRHPSDPETYLSKKRRESITQTHSATTQNTCCRNTKTGTQLIKYFVVVFFLRRSQRPRGLRCGCATARLLGLRVRIPPEARMSVSYECCMLSGRGLCVGLFIRPEESYRVWCVCDREASTMKRPWPTRGCRAMKERYIFLCLYSLLLFNCIYCYSQ
jgi:hypothetical protein